jgi:hypothetical protein
MELVPFSANGAGLALSAFGLGLIAKDNILGQHAEVSLNGENFYQVTALSVVHLQARMVEADNVTGILSRRRVYKRVDNHALWPPVDHGATITGR